jgi:hypothetical protein
MEHPTVDIDDTPIDEDIAPLIQLLWDLDLDTTNSCQDNNGRVWVEFATPYDAEEFLNRIAVYEDGLDTLYNRIRGAWVPIDDDTWYESNAWRYDVTPADLSVREEPTDQDDLHEFPEGPSEFTFRVSVRFPHADLPAVMQRLADELVGSAD